jgi:UPF0716 protein FxsA
MEPIVLGRLLLLFILVPMVELALLLLIGQYTGILFTLGLIVFTGALGAWLARHQGTQCLSRIQAELAKGQMPGDSLLDGLMILVAGAVLITPGVLTDILGFSLLIPPMRRVLKQLVIARFQHRIVVSGFSAGRRDASEFNDVIDVDHRPSDPPQGG